MLTQPGLADILKRNALETIKSYSWDNAMDRMENCLYLVTIYTDWFRLKNI